LSRLTLGLGLALLVLGASVTSVLVATSDHGTDSGWTLLVAIGVFGAVAVAFLLGILQTRLVRSSGADVVLGDIAADAVKGVADNLARRYREQRILAVLRPHQPVIRRFEDALQRDQVLDPVVDEQDVDALVGRRSHAPIYR